MAIGSIFREYSQFLIIFLMLPSLLWADDLSHCSGHDIRTISVPVVHNSNSPSRQASYKYRYVPASKRESQTVVVYLPGGPGGDSMSRSRPIGRMDTIYTDPRSVGCNSHQVRQFPNSSLTTESLANDVIKIIEQEGLKDYILFGVSYGTQLATVIANKIEQLGLPHPKAVVLDGILGRAFVGQEMIQNYLKQWDDFKATLPEGLLFEMEEGNSRLEITPESWGGFITLLLMMGHQTSLAGHTLKDFLHIDYSDSSKDEQMLLLLLIEELRKLDLMSPAGENLYSAIACSEIVEEVGGEFVLVNGKLVDRPGEDRCADLEMDNPFNSADYQIRSPILYFQGELDPATPTWQARYHFENQHSSDAKFFILFPDLGHNTISGTLEQECKDNIWESLRQGSYSQESLEKAFGSCNAKPIVKPAIRYY